MANIFRRWIHFNIDSLGVDGRCLCGAFKAMRPKSLSIIKGTHYFRHSFSFILPIDKFIFTQLKYMHKFRINSFLLICSYSRLYLPLRGLSVSRSFSPITYFTFLQISIQFQYSSGRLLKICFLVFCLHSFYSHGQI